MPTTARYIVKPPAHAGTHFQQFGWTVHDTQAATADFALVMSGDRNGANTVARAYNRRDREENQ